MSQIILAKGSQGALVERLQTALEEVACSPGSVDGDFGAKTEGAVRGFQRRARLAVTGEVEFHTWDRLLGGDPPPLFDRCLQLTAGFEGHGYSLVRGNFDGSGLTWGIIGFTLRHGQIQQVLSGLEATVIDRAFGSLAPTLRQILRAPREQQVAWADSISTERTKAGVSKPWREAFDRLGNDPVVRSEQRRLAESSYFEPAVRTAGELGMPTPLGTALCFDIHVQNGGLGVSARRQITALRHNQPGIAGGALRLVVAESVARSAKPQWRDDVRARKLTIAAGAGMVHGRFYVLRNWGLSG